MGVLVPLLCDARLRIAAAVAMLRRRQRQACRFLDPRANLSGIAYFMGVLVPLVPLTSPAYDPQWKRPAATRSTI
jgi:hypothetical protein